MGKRVPDTSTLARGSEAGVRYPSGGGVDFLGATFPRVGKIFQPCQARLRPGAFAGDGAVVLCPAVEEGAGEGASGLPSPSGVGGGGFRRLDGQQS